jgi:serine/threonine-protein kinase RsbW
MVAHAFEEGNYIDAQEIIWLAVELESKLQVEADVVDVWCSRLQTMADGLGLRRFKIWLISKEGFSDDACALLRTRNALGSSRRQVDLLAARLGDARVDSGQTTADTDEFLVVIPMGEENELIAAGAVEQIASRLKFDREAINQIKTAVVEACINAAEHSLSPDQKIYQRFRVESDKLVVTISSRGIVPPNLGFDLGGSAAQENQEERRGWGLRLIRTLMDEVEFERVDEGTSLRMTKYLQNSSS